MNKKIRIALAALILILLALVGYLNHRIREIKKEKQIQIDNVKSLLAENARRSELILTLKQVQGIRDLKIDSLSKALDIKPKTIIKTIEKTVYQADTTKKDIPVTLVAKQTWYVSDKDKCWTWEGVAVLNDDVLKVTRNAFDYHNKTTDIYYAVRTKKFLCIRYGKKKTFVKSSSECGESYTREIEIKDKI